MESNTMETKNTGLRNIPIADTKISYIDGEKGILRYRGYSIEKLAENSSFANQLYGGYLRLSLSSSIIL